MTNTNYKIKNVLEIIDYVTYNHDTGKVSSIVNKRAKEKYDKDGYLVIKIKGKLWRSHRLAYAKYHGVNICGVIDHINHIRDDNRIVNLRDVSQHINNKFSARKPNSDTGVIGIRKDCKTKGLISNFTTSILGKQYRFRTLTEAINFRKENYYGTI